MLSAFWNNLPAGVRHKLCIGSVGQQHLNSTAEMALAEGRPELARELCLAAWESNPLDLSQAAAALQADACAHTPCLAAMLREYPFSEPLPGAARDFKVLMDAGEREQCYDLALELLQPGNNSFFWAGQLLVLGMMLGKGADAVDRILASTALRGSAFAPLRLFLDAEKEFALERWEAAAEKYKVCAQSIPDAGWILPSIRQAEACMQLGRRDQVLELWRDVLSARPWHCNLLLRAHAEIAPPREPSQLPPTAALVYSWNKAALLHDALEALACSRGVERIVVLDNGSTDETPQVLRSWQERLGNECLEIHSLPVNIGAPAARNWLAALPSLQHMDCVAYLDDDALPPPDWLEKLHAARELQPKATAWGCCVVDRYAAQIMQSADLHLMLPAGKGDLPSLDLDLKKVYHAPVQLSQLHSQTPQRGQFHYLRPCLSVTGCCHLLDMRELREGGGFDLRFTPSQLDDVERDVRRGIDGRFCFYQGLLSVQHAKRSGCAVLGSEGATGNWFGNRYKLQHRFDEQALKELYRKQQKLLISDLEARFPALEQSLALGHG